MAELVEGGLTGARRFRYELVEYDQGNQRGLADADVLILQVQYNTWLGSETRPDGKWITEWRDATPDDITSAEEVV